MSGSRPGGNGSCPGCGDGRGDPERTARFPGGVAGQEVGGHPRPRPDLPAAWARVTAAGAPVARRAGAGAGAARDRMAAGYGSAPRTARWAVFVCLALIVVALGFIALHVLAGAPPAAPSAAGKH